MRIDICPECETSFTVDAFTGEGECPVCNMDIQDDRAVEYEDGHLRHYTLTDDDDYGAEYGEGAESDHYCDDMDGLNDDIPEDEDCPF